MDVFIRQSRDIKNEAVAKRVLDIVAPRFNYSKLSRDDLLREAQVRFTAYKRLKFGIRLKSEVKCETVFEVS